jgi:hypothetical protein
MLGGMEEHPNAALARRVWEALSRGDAESLRELIAPDLTWHVTARGSPWSGTRRGYDAVVDFLADLGERADDFDAKWQDVLVSDQHVLMIYHVRIGFGTRRAELDFAWLARVEKGRFAEVWTIPLDPVAVEAFWAEVFPDADRGD